MADIAMLVAEEYERRVKNSRKTADSSSGGGAVEEVVAFVSGASVLALAQTIKNKIDEENFEVVKLVLEPKSQIGYAAFTGLFSA